jgi:hypothetical protein
MRNKGISNVCEIFLNEDVTGLVLPDLYMCIRNILIDLTQRVNVNWLNKKLNMFIAELHDTQAERTSVLLRISTIGFGLHITA